MNSLVWRIAYIAVGGASAFAATSLALDGRGSAAFALLAVGLVYRCLHLEDEVEHRQRLLAVYRPVGRG